MTVVTRPDLTTRTALSKSAVVGWDLCATKAGYELTERRPLIPNEKISFGSALDAACEALVVGARDGVPRAMDHAHDAVAFVAERDGIELPIDELHRALRGFADEVLPHLDVSAARTQVELRATIAGLGDVEGHPDILVPGAVWDVKSAKDRAKDMPSVELGLYGILYEEAEATEVHTVGYLTWVRYYDRATKTPTGRGKWFRQEVPFTSEYRRWAWARVNQYAGAKAAGAFYGAPKFPSLCLDCQYAPANGGPCEIAWNGEDAA